MSGTSMATAAGVDACYGGSRQAQMRWLVTRDWLVGYAADSGKGAAITSQLVRGGGGVSVNKFFPATLVFMRARCWCACRSDCADGLAGPQISLSTGHSAGTDEPRANPNRADAHLGGVGTGEPAGTPARTAYGCGGGLRRYDCPFWAGWDGERA
jgi:hypothetical protein